MRVPSELPSSFQLYHAVVCPRSFDWSYNGIRCKLTGLFSYYTTVHIYEDTSECTFSLRRIAVVGETRLPGRPRPYNPHNWCNICKFKSIAWLIFAWSRRKTGFRLYFFVHLRLFWLNCLLFGGEFNDLAALNLWSDQMSVFMSGRIILRALGRRPSGTTCGNQ